MTATMNRAELDNIMAKVRALLLKAESTEFEAERATYAAKAEALMFKYRIEESMLAESDKGSTLAPIVVTWQAYSVRDQVSDDAQVLRSLVTYVLAHTGCRGIWESGFQYDDEGHAWRQIKVYGWESDIRYAEELYLSAKAAYLGRMAPTVDPSRSDDENAFRLRMAGVERGKIGQMIGWGDKAHIRVTNAVKRWAKNNAVPEDELSAVLGKGNSMKVWRAAFRESFTSTFWTRLYEARLAVDTTGGQVVPVSRAKAVDELYYRENPTLEYKPMMDQRCEECRRCSRHEGRNQAWGLPKPNKIELAQGYVPCECRPCSYHKWPHTTAAEANEQARKAMSPGQAAGASAARRVDIRREGSPVHRIGG